MLQNRSLEHIAVVIFATKEETKWSNGCPHIYMLDCRIVHLYLNVYMDMVDLRFE